MVRVSGMHCVLYRKCDALPLIGGFYVCPSAPAGLTCRAESITRLPQKLGEDMDRRRN
jgi:hypothetical protein